MNWLSGLPRWGCDSAAVSGPACLLLMAAGWGNDLQDVSVQSLTTYNTAVAQLRSVVSPGGAAHPVRVRIQPSAAAARGGN